MNALSLALALLAAHPAARDTLHLPELQQAALRTDPRARQLALQREASELRLRNLAAERLPALAGRAQATHQSEVATIPITLPGGQTPPTPPKDQYEARVEVEQLIYDGGVLQRRRGAERAQLTVEEARIAAELYPLREEVNETFFTAFLLQERLSEATTLIDDLDARLATLRAQVRNGAALPGDTAVVRAEQLKAMEDRAEIAAGRHAALARLALLTSVDVAERDVLALPRLGDAAARARAMAEPAGGAPVPGARPEYAVFAARRERLAREAEVVAARTRPQVGAFAQVAVGRPGFAQFERDLHDYWLAGVRMRWAPWTWGTNGRERELIEVQRRIVDTEEAAFTARLQRQVQDQLAEMDRLETALETDARIIALREQVERQARAQLDERAITASAYVDVRSKLEEARIARQRHAVELARARARYLTTLGIELP